MAHRNAASVLPVPVGASTSVDSPRAIAGQPRACAAVGAANDALNQSRTAGWNDASGIGGRAPETRSPSYRRTSAAACTDLRHDARHPVAEPV